MRIVILSGLSEENTKINEHQKQSQARRNNARNKPVQSESPLEISLAITRVGRAAYRVSKVYERRAMIGTGWVFVRGSAYEVTHL